jgi:hypothetical protein
MFRRQIGKEITSTTSMARYFTTTSGGIWTHPLRRIIPEHQQGLYAGKGIVKLTQKIAHLCSKERTIEDFGLSRAQYFRYSQPLSFPQREGV